jgi:nucleoside-diphosphate-sugar epimerase
MSPLLASSLPDTSDCLVTGATGLVGNNVVRQFVDRGRSSTGHSPGCP